MANAPTPSLARLSNGAVSPKQAAARSASRVPRAMGLRFVSLTAACAPFFPVRRRRNRSMPQRIYVICLAVALGCGDDPGGTAADRAGVGAACSASVPCAQVPRGPDLVQLSCLSGFRGGYCGQADCGADADCPDGSACVLHTDGHDYCFRSCSDKTDCNRSRSADNEANCSSNVDFVESGHVGKACVPPSSG